jgi:class 3 adenylate cyclase
MPLSADLASDTVEIFGGGLQITDGRVIPSIADIPLGNQGRRLRLVSLFVDIRKSTLLVDAMGIEPAARMYKSYLRGITKIARHRGGDVLSFNGDGIVCGFVGPNAENAAILTALNISYFCRLILRPQVLPHLMYPRLASISGLELRWVTY